MDAKQFPSEMQIHTKAIEDILNNNPGTPEVHYAAFQAAMIALEYAHERLLILEKAIAKKGGE